MNHYTKYYFLGIGGIGMSAIARFYNVRGFDVAGYDRTETKLTDDLQSEGIEISFDERITAIPARFMDKAKTLIILTPAIPESHMQLKYFREKGFVVMKRAEVLGEITRQSKGICIAGTHGKTSTSTIAAHLLYQSKVDCNAFLGGISNNYNTNLLLSKESNLVVIEADEYDRSFHHLRPYMAVITSADPDHLDIYKTHGAVVDSYEHFATLVKPGGALIVRKGINIHPVLQKGVKLYSYSMNEGGDFHAENIKNKPGEIRFDFVTPTGRIADIRLGVPVMINVENSVAALALAWLNGVTSDEMRTGLSSFSGIYRRFNIVYHSDKMVYIDDYAHHPSELEAGISSIRSMYPGKKVLGVFQPHLYTRTRDFAEGFAQVLATLDELVLLDIYPARELPLEGITSEWLLQQIPMEKKQLCAKENLVDLLGQRNDLEVLVTFGAGDIDALVPSIKKMLNKRNK